MKPSTSRTASTIGTAVACGVLTLGMPQASAASIEGRWSGGGYVQPANGQRERVRCRVQISRQSSKVYGVSATCASASTTINQTGELLRVNPSRFVGDFYNRQYNVSGRIRAVLSGSSLSVTFSGGAGSGSLSLGR